MTDSRPLYVSDPEKWLDEISEKYDLFCLVIFRGSWCKYDEHYLKRLGTDDKPDGVHMVAWTSEGEEGAKKAEEAWNLKELGYDLVLGDETMALAKHLVDDVVLPKLCTQPLDEVKVDEEKTYAKPVGYPNGLVQPGMVIYAHKGNMCFEWEATAEESNMFGAANRPQPEAVWDRVKHRKAALDHGDAVMPIHGESLKTCTAPGDV